MKNEIEPSAIYFPNFTTSQARFHGTSFEISTRSAIFFIYEMILSSLQMNKLWLTNSFLSVLTTNVRR